MNSWTKKKRYFIHEHKSTLQHEKQWNEKSSYRPLLFFSPPLRFCETSSPALLEWRDLRKQLHFQLWHFGTWNRWITKSLARKWRQNEAISPVKRNCYRIPPHRPTPDSAAANSAGAADDAAMSFTSITLRGKNLHKWSKAAPAAWRRARGGQELLRKKIVEWRKTTSAGLLSMTIFEQRKGRKKDRVHDIEDLRSRDPVDPQLAASMETAVLRTRIEFEKSR